MRGTTTSLCLATALLLATGATGCSDDGEDPPLEVGTTVTRELEGGGKAAYTLKNVIDPAEMKPGELPSFLEGGSWAALELRFENVGSKDIEERPRYRTAVGPREGEEPSARPPPTSNPFRDRHCRRSYGSSPVRAPKGSSSWRSGGRGRSSAR